MCMDLIIPIGLIIKIPTDTATGTIRLIQGVIPGAMAGTDTFDKVGPCLSMEKTHYKNERLLTQQPQHSQPQEKPEGRGEHKK